jgi:polyphosphate kinase 2 (PPK2 family)
VKHLRVDPGSAVSLAAIDPGFRGDHESEANAATDLQEHLARITKLQRKLYASDDKSLLIVLQGIDAAGKDGTCWHVISAMDPQGVQVKCFKQPTRQEADHDFLWRVHPHAPPGDRFPSSTDPITKTFLSRGSTSWCQSMSGRRAMT